MHRTLFWILLLVFSASSFGADLELSARTDNMYWSSDREDTTSGRTFDGKDLFYTLNASISQEVADGIVFKGGWDNDPVLRTRVYAQLGYSLESMSLTFTPFLGTFNSGKWFNPGVEALVEYTVPGLFFARGGFLTTFAPVAKNGDYYLSALNASVGALMENGILTFNILDKSATFKLPGTLSTVDGSTKYWMDLEMYLKNFPLRWAFLSGYQLTSRSYVTATEVSTPVHSVLFGARFSWDFGRGTTVFLQGESAFFQQAWDQAAVEVPANLPVFQAVGGVRFHW